jgi:hypothetical protein
MAWRVVKHDDQRWNVTMAVERRPNSPHWNLVFSFRPSTTGQRSIWATYPLSSPSKAALFAQADKLSDDALAALLAEQLQ